MPVVLTLWRVGWEGPCEFKVSLTMQCDAAQPCLCYTARPASKLKTNKKDRQSVIEVNVFPLQISSVKLKRGQASPPRLVPMSSPSIITVELGREEPLPHRILVGLAHSVLHCLGVPHSASTNPSRAVTLRGLSALAAAQTGEASD